MPVDLNILEKLQKILARADESRGSTKAETETAMAMAQELAAKHNLDLAQVMASMGEDERAATVEVEDLQVMYRTPSGEQLEHQYIRQVLLRCFDIKIMLLGKSSMVFIGEKADVAISQYAFKFLENRYSKLCREYVRTVGGKGYGTARQQHGFYQGLTYGIVEKNKRVKQDVEGTSTALVLRTKEAAIDERTKELFPDALTRKARDFETDHHAMRNGYRVGQTIAIAAGEIQ